MKLKMFTVYDDAAAAYLQPFFFATNAQAIRAFTELANDANHQFCKYAHQYVLFEVGSFDQQTGHMEVLPTPYSIGKAIEFRLNNQAELFPAASN